MNKVISLGGATNDRAYKEFAFYKLFHHPELQQQYIKAAAVQCVADIGSTKYLWLLEWAQQILFKNPDWYDGATGDMERSSIVIINSLGTNISFPFDWQAEIHDALQASGYTNNYNRLRASDWLLDKSMVDSGYKGFARGKRQLVEIVRRIQVFRIKKYVQNWEGPRDNMDLQIDIVLGNYKPKYVNMYKWLFIILIVLILAVYGLIKIVI